MDNLLRVGVVMSLLHFSTAAGLAQNVEGSKLFQGKCGGCHTIGKGALVGPDLAPAKDWKTVELTATVKRMEKMAGPLSDADVEALVDFLKTGATKGEPTNNNIDVSPVSPLPINSTEAPVADVKNETGSVEDGELLFSGKKQLSNGGMSCIACHTASGGHSSLGPDLRNIATKMNETALIASCEQTPFKVMRAAYAKHAVTRQEAINLSKYLISLKDKPALPLELPIGLYGAVGATAIMGALAVFYRKRNTSVSAKLRRR